MHQPPRHRRHAVEQRVRHRGVFGIDAASRDQQLQRGSRLERRAVGDAPVVDTISAALSGAFREVAFTLRARPLTAVSSEPITILSWEWCWFFDLPSARPSGTDVTARTV